MNKREKKKIIETLSRWASGDFVNMITDRHGICGNMMGAPDCNGYNLAHYFCSWGEFSGDTTFPVPHPRENSGIAYMVSNRNMWKFKYGNARMRLCAHIASEMKKEL